MWVFGTFLRVVMELLMSIKIALVTAMTGKGVMELPVISQLVQMEQLVMDKILMIIL